MKNITVKLNIDPRKYEATQQFMKEKGRDIEAELSKSVDSFYMKYVPAPVRKYIEMSASPTRSASAKSSSAGPEKTPSLNVSKENSDENSRNFGSSGSNES